MATALNRFLCPRAQSNIGEPAAGRNRGFGERIRTAAMPCFATLGPKCRKDIFDPTHNNPAIEEVRSPFQGLITLVCVVPGALPRAGLVLPLRGAG
jgi:hypothetical protein